MQQTCSNIGPHWGMLDMMLHEHMVRNTCVTAERSKLDNRCNWVRSAQGLSGIRLHRQGTAQVSPCAAPAQPNCKLLCNDLKDLSAGSQQTTSSASYSTSLIHEDQQECRFAFCRRVQA